MSSSPALAEIAALVGNPARANMLEALLGGRALTASELAATAHVAAPTTSGHLAALTAAQLLVRHRQGRHAYYRLASPAVGQMLEGIMAVAATRTPEHRPAWRGGETLRTARTCYDHLAGRLGVALADALVTSGAVVLGVDGGEVTRSGTAVFTAFGIELAAIRHRRRVFCRACLDWSERRPHLAGGLGAALAARSFERGWITRLPATRAVAITAAGEHGFADAFGVAVP